MTIIKRGWRSARKTFRFTFVDIPLGILGIHQLRFGNQYIKTLWQSLHNPHCPECDKGILIQQQDRDHTGQKHYCCKKCGYAIWAESESEVREEAEKQRIIKFSATFEQMNDAEKKNLTCCYRLHARLLFIASAIIFAGFIYLIMSGAAWLLALNWLSIAFMVWVFALKKSYRSWQIETGNLFVPGSFLYWLLNKKWIR